VCAEGVVRFELRLRHCFYARDLVSGSRARLGSDPALHGLTLALRLRSELVRDASLEDPTLIVGSPPLGSGELLAASRACRLVFADPFPLDPGKLGQRRHHGRLGRGGCHRGHARLLLFTLCAPHMPACGASEWADSRAGVYDRT
jgi:hypothetical protein